MGQLQRFQIHMNFVMKTLTNLFCYIDKLDDTINEYTNTYHGTINIKPVDVKDNACFDFSKEVNDKNSKYKVGNHTNISKYKNIFAKGYIPNQSENVFVIKEDKNTAPQFHEHI